MDNPLLCVAVLVHTPDMVLLGEMVTGSFDLPCNKVELGENLKQTCKRVLHEETEVSIDESSFNFVGFKNCILEDHHYLMLVYNCFLPTTFSFNRNISKRQSNFSWYPKNKVSGLNLFEFTYSEFRLLMDTNSGCCDLGDVIYD